MAKSSKYFSIVKTGIRGLIFYGMWLAPLFYFYEWHWEFAQPFLKNLEHSPWKFIFMALGWWCLSWISMYALQTIWPVLLLIFYRTERERSPKKIISIGDRFRKMGLSAPQIFLLKEHSRFWQNKIWGFFSLPSPLGALMLIDANIAQQLPVEVLDLWICQKIIESKFSRFSSTRFLFFAMVPTFTFIGAFAGDAFTKHDIEATELCAFGFFVLGLLIWRVLQVQRLHELDRKTIHHFHLDPKEYFECLEQAEKISPTMNLAKKFLGFNLESRMKSLEQTTWFKPWFPWALPPTILASLVTTFVVQTPVNELNTFVSAGVSMSLPAANLLPTAAPKAEIKTEPKVEISKEVASPLPTEVSASSAELSSLSQAVIGGDLRMVIRQIAAGKNIHEGDANANGATALMLAVKKGDLEMAYFLLALGANPQVETDSQGRSVLFYALESANRQQVLTYILRTRVDVDKKSKDGLTAMDFAKKNGWNDVQEILAQRSLASEAAQSEPSNRGN